MDKERRRIFKRKEKKNDDDKEEEEEVEAKGSALSQCGRSSSRSTSRCLLPSVFINYAWPALHSLGKTGCAHDRRTDGAGTDVVSKGRTR